VPFNAPWRAGATRRPPLRTMSTMSPSSSVSTDRSAIPAAPSPSRYRTTCCCAGASSTTIAGCGRSRTSRRTTSETSRSAGDPHHHDVGPVDRGQTYEVAAGAGIADDEDPPRLEDRDDAGAYEPELVGDDRAGRAGLRPDRPLPGPPTGRELLTLVSAVRHRAQKATQSGQFFQPSGQSSAGPVAAEVCVRRIHDQVDRHDQLDRQVQADTCEQKTFWGQRSEASSEGRHRHRAGDLRGQPRPPASPVGAVRGLGGRPPRAESRQPERPRLGGDARARPSCPQLRPRAWYRVSTGSRRPASAARCSTSCGAATGPVAPCGPGPGAYRAPTRS